MVAVIVINSVSWWRTWASSCAITPASSSLLTMPISPVVTATAALFRVPAGGERVRLGILHDVDLRHGKPRIFRRAAAPCRRAPALRAASTSRAPYMRKHRLVGVPIGPQIHAAGDEEGDDHAGLAADQKSDAHEQRGHRGEQDGGAEIAQGNLHPKRRAAGENPAPLNMLGVMSLGQGASRSSPAMKPWRGECRTTALRRR